MTPDLERLRPRVYLPIHQIPKTTGNLRRGIGMFAHYSLWIPSFSQKIHILTVVYWPSTRPNMPFQRRRSCIFRWRGRAWLTIWDRVKIPRYSHKLMHRKRVTCELHDSYFRSMTIKDAIPKTAEVHIPMASYGEILSGRELLYNWVHRKFNQLETRCSRESQHPAEGALRSPIDSLETRPVGDKMQ